MEETRVFKHITIVPDYNTGHFIQWTLDPFFHAPRPYNFSLLISQTLDFSEIIVQKDNLGETFFVIDDTNLKQSLSANYLYKIVLTDARGHKYSSFPVLFGHTKADRRKYAMAAEVLRKEHILCRYAGAQAWLIKRKTYGQQSAQTIANIDPISGVPLTDIKHEDFGIGLDDGYFDPVPCAYMIENSSEDKQLDPAGMGVKETFDLVTRMPGYPAIDTRDILCTNVDGYRYSVMNRQGTYFPGTNIVILQKASLRLIPQTDTIYSIEIPLDLNE